MFQSKFWTKFFFGLKRCCRLKKWKIFYCYRHANITKNMIFSICSRGLSVNENQNGKGCAKCGKKQIFHVKFVFCVCAFFSWAFEIRKVYARKSISLESIAKQFKHCGPTVWIHFQVGKLHHIYAKNAMLTFRFVATLCRKFSHQKILQLSLRKIKDLSIHKRNHAHNKSDNRK